MVAAITIALIALGWACRRHSEYGIWHPGSAPTILCIDPELAAYGYQCYGSEGWISSDFFVDRTPPIDPFGWDVVKESPSPAWAFDVARKGFITAGRSEIGWPLRYARVEFRESEPETPQALLAEPTAFVSDAPEVAVDVTGFHSIGPVSIATRPLFPGFLLLVAAVCGVLAGLEWAMKIPRRLRANRRRRRGCCERCGYDLSGIDGAMCPECGTNPRQPTDGRA